MHTSGFLSICVLFSAAAAATISSEVETELLPSVQLSSGDAPLAIIPPLKTLKVGRKDRCRHVVRREVQKYAAKVQRLTDKVLSLQDELTQLRQQQISQGEQFSDIRANLTEQRQLLNRALKSVENLTLHRGENGSVLPEQREPHTGIAKDCDEIYREGGMRFAGTYQMTIQPRSNHSSFNVLCEPLNNAGWVVIQNRYDGTETFNRQWHEYKKGFGKLQSEFWLGNELIHRITSAGPTTLRVELEEFSGRKHWAEYSDFSIDNEASNYKMHISGYSGNAGDSLRSLNNIEFSTPEKDRDNDKKLYDHCAALFSSGWWYGNDCVSNLNGAYLDRDTHDGLYGYEGIIWPYIHSHRSLKGARMLLKPTP